MAMMRSSFFSSSSPSSPATSCASSSSSSSPLSVTSSPSSSITNGDATTDASTRCRYKTGRCGNARVVKPNGSLLLLCEYHRDQQNRTKKRSDMKYRHHRAKKRQLERYSPRLHTPSSSSLGLRYAASQLAITITQPFSQLATPSQPLLSRASRMALSFGRPTLSCEQPPPQQQMLSPIVSTPTMLSSSASGSHTVLTRRESTSSAAFKQSALFKLRTAHVAGSRISPGKARLGHHHQSSAQGSSSRFALSSRRDIVAMASPASKVTDSVSPMVFPLCLSPLQHNSPWARAWQPEDVRLLEYFIM